MGRRDSPLHTDFDAPMRRRFARRSSASTWRDAVRRGAILDSVLACHLVILMLVLHPSWHRIEHVTGPQDGDVLRLTLDPLPEIFRFSPVRARTRTPAKVKPMPSTIVPPEVVSAVVTHPPNVPASTATALTIAPPPMTGDLQRSYQPGDFQTALQDAQRTIAEHIPGAAVPLIGGIRLQDRSSIKGAVHVVTEYIRCTDKQLEMQNGPDQFSTLQLMDRALEADGCGPHLEHTAADATIDAISRRAIFGN